MTVFLLDSSVLIDHLRGVTGAVALCREAAQAEVALWSVTPVRTEILAGMRSGEERPTCQLLNVLKWQDVTIEVADKAGELAARYLKSHRHVDTVDYIVAAAALLLDAKLQTMNVKHFPMFRGLAPPYLYA